MPAELVGPASNLDLLDYTISLKLSLEACNQDKAALRDWTGAEGDNVQGE